MAWLGATPKPPPGSKRAKHADEAAAVSRVEQMKKDGITPSMPPNPAPHVVHRLVEMGITEANGMGASPLSWREIRAWQESTAVDLAPWEARLMRHLSTAYLAESRRAESENCPPPWRAEVTEREREIEQAKLEMVLG
jgi:hypothetical protein